MGIPFPLKSPNRRWTGSSFRKPHKAAGILNASCGHRDTLAPHAGPDNHGSGVFFALDEIRPGPIPDTDVRNYCNTCSYGDTALATDLLPLRV